MSICSHGSVKLRLTVMLLAGWLVIPSAVAAVRATDVWIGEERAFLAIRERLGTRARVYYRHRPKNVARKSGNIDDFVTRWGGAPSHLAKFCVLWQ